MHVRPFVLASIAIACRQPPEPHATGCTYTPLEGECTYAKADVDPNGRDDAAVVTVQYDYATPTTTRVFPSTQRWVVPRDRTDEFVESFQAQQRVKCRGHVLASGACPPDTTRVEQIDAVGPTWAKRE